MRASGCWRCRFQSGVTDEVAAAFTLTYATSHHALFDRGQLKAGETLLVLGAGGGVGLAAVELGKVAGLDVIAAASSAEKLAGAKEHGADDTIKYATQDLRDAVKALTGGKGIDVIYDPSAARHRSGSAIARMARAIAGRWASRTVRFRSLPRTCCC